MTRKSRIAGFAAGAAMTGLIGGAALMTSGCMHSSDAGTNMSSPATTHSCKGQNDCKGKGGCKTGDNGCAGKNSCKGKGGCSGKQM